MRLTTVHELKNTKRWQLDATVVERWYIKSYMDTKKELLCIPVGVRFVPQTPKMPPVLLVTAKIRILWVLLKKPTEYNAQAREVLYSG